MRLRTLWEGRWIFAVVLLFWLLDNITMIGECGGVVTFFAGRQEAAAA